MSTTQFAMVEELASLVKDNYPSRHLVLAVEDALVNYLQEDPSPDGILELEPMSSYNRLILHRLADIFGFAHESVGEGDDRHLVLQQSMETLIPSILVSDILWQHDVCEASPSYQLLRRADACTVLKMNVASPTNFLEREAAYVAARERIFGMDESDLREPASQKPKSDPVVARRMIAHALGQRINQSSQTKGVDVRHPNVKANAHDLERRINVSEPVLNSSDSPNKNVRFPRAKATGTIGSPPAGHDEFSRKSINSKASGAGEKPSGRDGLGIPKMSMKEENFGAAKRMFAHALGRQGSKDAIPRCREVKSITE